MNQNIHSHPIRWVLPLGIIFLVCLARVAYVSLYAHSLPFWDQWDMVHGLIGPWQHHAIRINYFFSPHNEHRIVFTRIVTTVLFLLDQNTYDNLVEAYANIIIYAITLAFLSALLSRGMELLPRLVVGISVAVLGMLPFDWENTLVGFQNQFYFMIFFAACLIGLVAYRMPTIKNGIWLLLVAILCLFTMASGALAIAAGIAMIVFRSFCRQPSFPPIVVIVLVLVFIAGIMSIPVIAPHQALKSSGIIEFAKSFLAVAIWPLQPLTLKHFLIGGLIWIPSLIQVARIVRIRHATSPEIFSIGMSVWVVLQMAAIAHSRGHDLQGLPPRYSEIMAVELIVNLSIAIQLIGVLKQNNARLAGIVAITTIYVLVAYTFVIRCSSDLGEMRQRYAINQIETVNVIRYLSTGQLVYLQQPGTLAPYPDAKKLQSLISDQYILRALPLALWWRQAGTNDILHIEMESLPHLSAMASRFQDAVSGIFNHFGTYRPDTLFRPDPQQLSLRHAEVGDSMVCSLDVIDGEHMAETLSLPARVGITLDGWVFGRKRVVGDFYVILAGNKVYSLSSRADLYRPDVVRVFGQPNAKDAGFSAIAALTNVEPGVYKLLLGSNDGSEKSCDTRHVIYVTPEPGATNDGQTSQPMQAIFTAYAKPLPRESINAQCYLDAVDGHGMMPNANSNATAVSDITFSGWYGDGRGQLPKRPSLVLASDAGAWAAPVVTDVKRSDVAAALQSNGLTYAGYNLVARIAAMPAGRYALYMVDEDETGATCNLNQTLVIQPKF